MAAPVVSMVLNQLGTFLREETHKEVIMVLGAKEGVQKLELTLIAIQAVLHDADKKQVQDKRVKLWLERLKEIVYEIEDILDKLNTKIIQSKIRNQNSPFIVSKGHNLGDLKGLNLIGSIEISGLWRVKSANEAKEVHLANKLGIHALALDFSFDFRSDVDIRRGGYEERMEGVLEGLEPHPNLEELKIKWYPGSKLPSWMMSDLASMYSKLRTLELMHLTRCTKLPSLGKLPVLEVLKIGAISVRRLGLDFLGISDIEVENDDAISSINREKLVALPSLIQLELSSISELEEWVLPFERSDTLQIMPRLRKLTISWAYKLKVLPALGRLESLEELTLTSLDSLKHIGPEFFGISEDDIMKGTSGSSRGGESLPIIVFPKLKKLIFFYLEELEEWEMMMPSWREDVSFIMPCLKELELHSCKKLKVVPHNIFSYQTVEEKIDYCPELNQRSGRNQIIRRRKDRKSAGNMALFRRLFNRKPPNRLLEISERVYVFDSCFSMDILEEGEFKSYMDGIVVQLQNYFPDSSFMVFNFKEGEKSKISDLLSEHNMTVMDYPRQYGGCPVLPLGMINHFLKSSEGWLSLEGQQNVLLMHCERGGWPVLAFMLAGLLLYRKQYTGELKTLEMVYKQAPIELLHLLSPLNPKPSQMRYLQYISSRNLDSDWPPSDTPLTLNILILRSLPLINGEKSCMPIVRVYGQDLSAVASKSSKILFSTPKTKKHVLRYTKAEEHTSIQKIDISCLVQGDVVLECIHLNDDLVHEKMMFRIMFNTALVQSNILMLGREEIDGLWDNKDQLPKEFKAEVLFSDFNAIKEDEEEFFEAEEIFSNVDGKMDSDCQFVDEIFTDVNRKGDPNIQVGTQNECKNLGELAGVPTVFCFEDLKMATNNFQDKLGSGGSGFVFKGVLNDGTLVAVKRVQHVTLGERIYVGEVSALANVKHVHLVTLRGYCIHMTEMGKVFFIVYDLLPNGSLDDWIFSRTGGPTSRYLSWKSRCRIVVDVAEALAYLHHDCSPQILHLDVKPDNILLDNNFRGVLSDFGLSRLMQNDVGTVFSTIRGTLGYIAPGWNYGISVKCDIYSYGKVLLDIFFGKRYVCLNLEGIDIYKRHSEGGNSEREQRIFHAFMWKRLRQCKIMDLIDKRLVENEEVDEREAICLVYAALSCLQDEPELRPHDMREVIDILNQKIQKDIEEEDDATTESICREKLVVFPNLIQLVLLFMWELEEWVLPFERSDTLHIMPRLRIPVIHSAHKLNVLPVLGRLELLEELTIFGLHSVKRTGPEFFEISDEEVMKGTSGSSSTKSVPIIIFPKLKTLHFLIMEEWEEWEMMMPSWREDVSVIMPCLKELSLYNCCKLKVVPSNIFSYQPVKEDISYYL
ncbi:hypothetical protein GIB67_011008 [Kingdonia uniflora]|uniref:Uncharacterized protein n=1 Tax=Kingdonia uniflora TaxID=39325 RepID=A0A7J7L6J0_9MAGN|nr:hypothetical protein GIB67_011008 [Kingdonia uniflora]